MKISSTVTIQSSTKSGALFKVQPKKHVAIDDEIIKNGPSSLECTCHKFAVHATATESAKTATRCYFKIMHVHGTIV